MRDRRSKDPAVNRAVCLPVSLWAQVDEAARQHGLSRSAWLRNAVLMGLAAKPRRAAAPAGSDGASPEAGAASGRPSAHDGAGATSPGASGCLHPVGRRIGSQCGQCGARLAR